MADDEAEECFETPKNEIDRSTMASFINLDWLEGAPIITEHEEKEDEQTQEPQVSKIWIKLNDAFLTFEMCRYGMTLISPRKGSGKVFIMAERHPVTALVFQ